MNQKISPHKRPRLLTVVILAVISLVVLTVGGFVVWCLLPSPANTVALSAMSSDETVTVSAVDWLEFSPRRIGLSGADSTQVGEAVTGFVFYPGMHVEARAYAPLAKELARSGYLVVIVPMPLNLALLDQDAAAKVMKAYPAVSKWVIGGHSMGATMAGEFIARQKAAPLGSANGGKISGLVIWGSWVISDLSAVPGLPVISISADRDGNCPPALVAANKVKLPRNTRYEVVQGGNHAQFGCYGKQFGDNDATISAEEQRRQTVAWTLQFLEKVGKN